MARHLGGTGPFAGMPDGLVAAVSSCEPDNRETILANWAAISESERDQYRNFVQGRFWPNRRRRSKIAAARLAKYDYPGDQRP